MTFVTVTECLYHRSPRICSKCGIQIRSFPHTWNITDCYTWVTRRVPLLEQNLLTLPRHMTSPLFLLKFLFRNLRLFCVRFLFYFLTIVFFLFPLDIVLSVLLWCTGSDYIFVIIKCFLTHIFQCPLYIRLNPCSV